MKPGMVDGHVGTLGYAKYDLNRHRWMGMRPKIWEIFPLCGKESSCRANLL